MRALITEEMTESERVLSTCRGGQCGATPFAPPPFPPPSPPSGT